MASLADTALKLQTEVEESDYELPGYIVDALFTLDVVIARAKKRVDKGEGEGEVKPEDVPLTAEDIKNISRKIHTATKTAHAKINEIDPTGPEIKEFQAFSAKHDLIELLFLLRI